MLEIMMLSYISHNKIKNEMAVSIRILAALLQGKPNWHS